MGTLNEEPQEYGRNTLGFRVWKALAGIFLSYSNYISGVPWLGAPMRNPFAAFLWEKQPGSPTAPLSK